MKKRKAIVLNFIFIFFPLVWALLVSRTLLAQPGNKHVLPIEKIFRHITDARFPYLFGAGDHWYRQYPLRSTNTSDSLNVRLIGRWAYGPCFNVAGSGSIAYFGNGGYLEIVNFSNLATPIELGKVLIPGLILKVAYLEKYVYAADDNAILHIIDVSNPENPQEVSQVTLPDEISDVAVSGNYVCVTMKKNLQIIDISNPASPQAKASTGIGLSVQAVALSGNYAYVVDLGTGLHIIDISNPARPQGVGAYGKESRYSGVAVSGKHVYIAEEKFGLRIVNAGDPKNPQEVASIATKLPVHRAKISGNYVYLACGTSGLQLIDVTNPMNPQPAGSIDTKDHAYDVAIGTKYAYVADYSSLQVIYINDPQNPVKVGQFATGASAYGMAFKDNYAYIADGYAGIFVIDISNPTSPILKSHFLTTCEALDVLSVGNYLYVAGGDSGIQVLYASDPNNLLYKATLDVGGYVFSMTRNSNFVYVAATSAGLRVIDVAAPNNPHEVGSFNTHGYACNVAVSGHYAYVADADSGLLIIDITSPTNLQEVGYFDTEGIAIGVAVSEDYAYVADGEAGLRVIDVSNPGNPQEVGKFDTKDISQGVTVSGNNAYLADGEAGLRVIDVSNPHNPRERGYYDTGSIAFRVLRRDNYLYLTDGFDGLYILEYLNLSPMAPIPFQPANNSYINDDTPSLIWNVPSDPEGDKLHFMIELALDSDFSIPIPDSPFKSEEDTTGFNPTPPLAEGSGTCSYTLQLPLDDQKYYWRVSAKDASSSGPVSETFSFTIDTQPPFTSDHNPAKNADSVLANSDIVVHIQDTLSGVDQSSIVMKVNGSAVIPGITGTGADYTLIYDPPADFEYNETVTVSIDAGDNAGNQMITDIYSFITTGGEMVPVIVATPTYRDFGNVPVGQTKDQTFVVTNAGTAILEVDSVSVVGPDREQFSIVSAKEFFSISPGDSATIIVRFSPVWSGIYIAKLQLCNNDPSAMIVEINLTGTGDAIIVSNLTNPDEQPGGSEQTAYRLVSVPLDLDDCSIESVLEDDLGSYDINNWRLFDFIDGQYLEYPDVSQFTLGRALWLILKNSTTIDCGPGKLVSDRYFSIPLNPGWNPIAIPYNQSIPIENLSLTSGNSLQLWYYDGWWNDNVTDLEPWKGYALLNDNWTSDTLLVYPDFSGPTLLSKREAATELLDWWIQIEASSEQAKDPRNILGVSHQASSCWDQLDKGKPPAVGKYIMVYFDHPEWKRVISKYSRDCRSPFTEGESWNFNVSSNMIEKEIELNFTVSETVPKQYDVVLLDHQIMTKQDLRLDCSYKFYCSTEPDVPRLFNILVGIRSYIKKASAEFQSLPTSFYLSEGYPNPFNASTTFQLNLPQNDRVRIEIYDLLGRKVVELMNDRGLDAGSHQMRWDGKNQSGVPVAGGIYLVLFKIHSSHQLIRKVVLVK